MLIIAIFCYYPQVISIFVLQMECFSLSYVVRQISVLAQNHHLKALVRGNGKCTKAEIAIPHKACRRGGIAAGKMILAIANVSVTANFLSTAAKNTVYSHRVLKYLSMELVIANATCNRGDSGTSPWKRQWSVSTAQLIKSQTAVTSTQEI